MTATAVVFKNASSTHHTKDIEPGSARGQEGAAETKTDQEASDAQVILDIDTFMHNIHVCV